MFMFKAILSLMAIAYSFYFVFANVYGQVETPKTKI